MVKYQETTLDTVFSALGDATRRAILARLAEGDARVTELAAPHDMSLPAVSKHLRVLENAGLLRKEKDGREIRCRLDPEALKHAADWVDQYRRFWEGQFDQLARYLDDAQPDREKPDE
jgi:DNA-binding transcriptional ArsR family regulator